MNSGRLTYEESVFSQTQIFDWVDIIIRLTPFRWAMPDLIVYPFVIRFQRIIWSTGRFLIKRIIISFKDLRRINGGRIHNKIIDRSLVYIILTPACSIRVSLICVSFILTQSYIYIMVNIDISPHHTILIINRIWPPLHTIVSWNQTEYLIKRELL